MLQVLTRSYLCYHGLVTGSLPFLSLSVSLLVSGTILLASTLQLILQGPSLSILTLCVLVAGKLPQAATGLQLLLLITSGLHTKL